MGWWSKQTVELRESIVSFMGQLLTKPLRAYEQRIPNDVQALRSQLRPGDIILVEGDQRISQVIRYLTQSSWSHAAIYIGDELRRLRPEALPTYAEAHGPDGRFLVLEALESGVTCSPITKYTRHNIRICRPRNLRREDLEQILIEVVGQLGKPYNMRHVLELGRYFFPVSLIPRRYRRAALRYGGEATEVICTTMLARAFAGVGYPIVPRVTVDEIENPQTWFDRLRRRDNNRTVRALYEKEDPALITPRDFDLSPYFDVIKFNHLANGKFDYRRIEWANSDLTAPPPVPAAESNESVESNAA